jgi:nucleoside-diphosphate-sugar epimerase
MSVREIADVILDLVGSSSPLEYHPLPSDDPTRRRPDISKAKRVLGWEPLVPVREGLGHTIEYYRSRMPAHRSNGHRKTARQAQVASIK